MDSRLKCAFLASHARLVRRLELASVLPFLVSENVVTPEEIEKERIQNETSSVRQVEKLLMVVHRRGVNDPAIYSRLLSVLKNPEATSGQNLQDIVKQIEEDSRNENIQKRFEVREDRADPDTRLKNAFLACHALLVRRLEPMSVLASLVSEDIITLDLQARIQKEPSSGRQVDKLLNALHRRWVNNPAIFTRLLSILKNPEVMSGQNFQEVIKQIEEAWRNEDIQKQFAEESHIAQLRKHESAILSVDVHEVLPSLISIGVITPQENEAIRSFPVENDQAKELWSTLHKKGLSGFKHFVVVLRQSGYYQQLADQLAEGLPNTEREEREDRTDGRPPNVTTTDEDLPDDVVQMQVQAAKTIAHWHTLVHGRTPDDIRQLQDLLSKAVLECYPPSMQKLNTGDLQRLTRLLFAGRAKWRELGMQLGVSKGRLKVIEEEYGTSHRRFTKVISSWMSGTESPTVHKLVDGLRSDIVYEEKLAEVIEMVY